MGITEWTDIDGDGVASAVVSGDGGGAVSSVAGRTGDVVLAVADVSGAAPAASPTLTGTVTLPSGLVLPSGVHIPSSAVLDGDLSANSHKLTNLAAATAAADAASKSYADAQNYLAGVNTFMNLPLSYGTNASVIISSNANDGRYNNLVWPKTGTLAKLACFINTTQATTNMNMLILDTGQAAAGTTRTCLWIGTPAQVPAANAWFLQSPGLSVVAGTTASIVVTCAGTTAKVGAGLGGSPAIASLPDSTFGASSGAGTSNGIAMGTIAAANMPAAVSNTVTNANMLASSSATMFFIYTIT